MHLYKAKVRLLQGQVKTSKKEIKNALEIFQRELRPTPADAGASGKQVSKAHNTLLFVGPVDAHFHHRS